ncbi:MAG: class I SAM-dependent methyltransferase [Syntrophobacteraceae bacterium]
MLEITPCSAKKQSELALEWDQLAVERHRQIVSGEDFSFDYILVPTILRLLEETDPSLVLDIGSGTGDFTVRLSKWAMRVIGIDSSRVSIDVARASWPDRSNVCFIHSSLEEITTEISEMPFTAATACMTLMTTPDLVVFAGVIARILPKNAKFVAMIPHPCFWPKYWGYETEKWFNYTKEIFIEGPFVISSRRTKIRTTHVHRPLEQYLSVFKEAGFTLDGFLEPMPTPEINALYPKPWQFPRFIGLRWAKAKEE